jgi:uncharacterized membrane protein YgcG
MAPALDPLRYGSAPVASAMGGMSYKLRYDPWYGAKFYAAVWAGIALLAAVFVFAVQQLPLTPMNLLTPGMCLLLAGLTLVFYPVWKRYDLGATVNYCQRQLGPGASASAVRACTETRENFEGANSGGGGGFFTGLLFGSMMNY